MDTATAWLALEKRARAALSRNGVHINPGCLDACCRMILLSHISTFEARLERLARYVVAEGLTFDEWLHAQAKLEAAPRRRRKAR